MLWSCVTGHDGARTLRHGSRGESRSVRLGTVSLGSRGESV